MKKIEPVLLTPEILKGNGWIIASNRNDEHGRMECLFLQGVGYVYFHSGGRAELDIIGYGIGHNGKGKFRGEVRSVHELQHAFRLCGLNEMADDFKV